METQIPVDELTGSALARCYRASLANGRAQKGGAVPTSSALRAHRKKAWTARHQPSEFLLARCLIYPK